MRRAGECSHRQTSHCDDRTWRSGETIEIERQEERAKTRLTAESGDEETGEVDNDIRV